jgi:hypothetical protein
MMNTDDNTERTILGLLRLIGWQSGRDRELTEEEAELILEVAATQPVSEDDRARLRERVLNRRQISFVTLLKERTGERKQKVLADELGVTVQFLVLVSEHSALLTLGARSEIANRVKRARGIELAETIRALQGGPAGVQKAASRSSAHEAPKLTYEDLVQHAGLDEKEKKIWMSLK